MKYLDWDIEKNEWLIRERGISFEEVLVAIEEGRILDIVPHPNQKQYPGQRMFVLHINEYAYVVPFVEDGEKLFLKTIIPSRKATKKYIKKSLQRDNEEILLF